MYLCHDNYGHVCSSLVPVYMYTYRYKIKVGYGHTHTHTHTITTTHTHTHIRVSSRKNHFGGGGGGGGGGSSMKWAGQIHGWGIQGTFPPPQAQQLLSCTSDLPFVQKMQQMYKISDDLATISMISDERTMIFCLGIVVSHREMPKVGVVSRLRMRFVHNLIEFPPPLVALHSSLMGVALPIQQSHILSPPPPPHE